MRECIKCKCVAPEAQYPKRGNACKKCVAEYMSIYRSQNAEKIALGKKQWKQNNTEHVKEKDRQYAEANPDKRQKARLKWAASNPDKNKAAKAKYVCTYPEKVKAAKNAWAVSNVDKRRVLYAKRRAAKRNAIPKWVTEDEWFLVAEAYHLAKLREMTIGYKWHVDHIIPLQNALVCGLHAVENLQVIPAVLNTRKGNKYTID